MTRPFFVSPLRNCALGGIKEAPSEEPEMRFALSFALMFTATVALSEDTVAQTASQISEEDCIAFAEISDMIAEQRQAGKSEKRTTRILTRGRKAVDERLRPAVPALVSYFYTLPKEAVVPGAASEAFMATCSQAAGGEAESADE